MSQALITACSLHRNELARYLLRHTAADPRRPGFSFEPPTCYRPVTALIASFRFGNTKMCSELMQCITVHAIRCDTDSASNTLLHLAIWCHLLNSRSADFVALHDACKEGDVSRKHC
jgi:hypothetical protein